MITLLSGFRSIILDHPTNATAADLMIERSSRFSCHYAPFDYINQGAKVVLLGITPGAQQARNALTALRTALNAGASDEDALRRAKETASFSGPMRTSLIAMLDCIKLHRTLGLDSCGQLFDQRTHLVHFTSALRYPVFVDGQDYSGTPPILSTPFLASMSERWLSEELAVLNGALWIPLGKEATAVLKDAVHRGLLPASQALDGLPHPSGANAERVAYFLGNKPREALSQKTNPDKIDAAREKLLARVSGFKSQLTPSVSREEIANSPTHLMSVLAFDKEGHKVYPYKGKSGPKKGLYSVNFTNDTKRFEGMNEAQLVVAIRSGRFRDRGTIRMCRLTATSGSNAFAPVMIDGKRIKDY